MTTIVDVNGIPQGSGVELSNTHQQRGIYGPGYVSSHYYVATGVGHHMTTGTAQTITTGSIYYFPFFCSSSANFSSINARVVAGGALSNINLGVYENSFGKPVGDPIPGTTSGSLPTATNNTTITYSFASPLKLKSSTYYWLACSSDATLATFMTSATITSSGVIAFNTSLGESTINGSNNCIMGWSQTFAYNTTLPTAGSLSEIATITTALPILALRAT